VYGLTTYENDDDEELFPFFNYDEIFGTLLNRFIVQAVSGYPLTVYGRGGQTRGYLNIKDTLNCVRLSIENPADNGELRVFNQFTETFSVNDIAERVRQCGERNHIDVRIKSLENPRKELEEHYYNPAHTGLLDLGLEPHLLTDDVLDEMLQTVIRYKEGIRKDVIFRGIKWA
jgi:UDP-sulfoquinovose synthase